MQVRNFKQAALGGGYAGLLYHLRQMTVILLGKFLSFHWMSQPLRVPGHIPFLTGNLSESQTIPEHTQAYAHTHTHTRIKLQGNKKKKKEWRDKLGLVLVLKRTMKNKVHFHCTLLNDQHTSSRNHSVRSWGHSDGRVEVQGFLTSSSSSKPFKQLWNYVADAVSWPPGHDCVSELPVCWWAGANAGLKGGGRDLAFPPQIMVCPARFACLLSVLTEAVLRSARCSVRLSSEGRSFQQTRPQQEDGRTGAAAENNIYELSSEEIKRNKQRSVFYDEVKFFCKIQQGCSWPVIPPPTPPTLTTIRMEELFLYALFKCVFCLFI